MAITPITQINQMVSTKAAPTVTENESPFKSFFQSALNQLDTTNQLNKTADQMSLDFAVGKIDNIADVMVAQEKASIALQYTVQLRNKLLDAYNEIMRIQL